ncbi:MAG TPA: excinuclease ABC subunit UvrB [Microthrixaceae bacterium]|jgi:excinuclease ABC subunit B|nr:excinuclease ABC subunit UvrB [Microthrixaceae bacterium]HMS14017.1 excinuclease ABC subunit UvrB [Microthrixaceae bacterium]HMT59682.1 excinuclease ABC subunit UvrB [Microthrixaceae bacterium]
MSDLSPAADQRSSKPFVVRSEFQPAGDQPKAIGELADGVWRGERFQTLLGITGSGKSATIAWTIEQVQRPTLVLAPNKSLAAQLATEFREFFPDNRVEYFVSYYDYYQPEAYIASSDTYIEKDSSVNDEIDRLRHSATASLLTRRDVIVVASVSCIYGLGSPEEYSGKLLSLRVGDEIEQRAVLRQLVNMQYERNEMNLIRGKFRVKGDVLEIHPAYDETAIRVELFGDEIETITVVDPLTGDRVRTLDEFVLFPATHYSASDDRLRSAVTRIEAELQERLAYFEREGKLLEAQRLRMRTQYDLENIAEMGFCNGIENYSAPIDGRAPGEPPFTLLDFFPRDYLTIIDESHVTIPQLHGQYEGDRSRKNTLIEHGFRLPSAADNRPLRFEEWVERAGQTIFLSATPSPWEREHSGQIVEQVVRPTGLVDPEVAVIPTKGQIDDLVARINAKVTAGDRVLVTTLTKKMAEDLTDYLLELGIRVRYLHSEVDTIARIELIRDLRLGDFDVLVGINLLREGLDIPEVSLVAILDADKEGFLRSETSLIQMIGRAARNVDGEVIMYADNVTASMQRAISETNRRRAVQVAYNAEHGIEPTTIRKAVNDILADLRGTDASAPVPGGDRRRQRAGRPTVREEFRELAPQDLGRLIQTLEDEMHEASADLRFEYAARLRDEIKELKRELRDAGVAG